MKHKAYQFLAAILLAVAGVTTDALADQPEPPTPHNERYFQELWAAANEPSQLEVVFESGRRADVVTETHAIEVDFAKKYGEAIEQSTHYAEQSGKRAGIVLIVLDEKDQARLETLLAFIKRFSLPIDVWSIDGEGAIVFEQEGALDE